MRNSKYSSNPFDYFLNISVHFIYNLKQHIFCACDFFSVVPADMIFSAKIEFTQFVKANLHGAVCRQSAQQDKNRYVFMKKPKTTNIQERYTNNLSVNNQQSM